MTDRRTVDGQTVDGQTGRTVDGLTDGQADGHRKTDGLTEMTGGLTDADGQADGWTREGRTGDVGARRRERERRQQEGA